MRPGGRIALLDVDTPRNPVMRWGHGLYFGKVVPRIGGALSDRAAYSLPAAQRRLPAARVRMVASLRAAGFTDAEHEQLSGGITQLLLATHD